MKKLFALVAVGLLILGAASCDTKNIGHIAQNALPTIDNIAYVQATGVMTVTASDANNDTITVNVTVPTGLAVDAASKQAAATGHAAFTWTATDAAAGGSGSTTVTISDGHGGTDSQTQAIVVDPVGGNVAPVIGAVTFDNVSGLMTVPVTDANATDTVTVTVTDVAGLTYTIGNATVTGGAGNATFTWAGVGSGNTTITASDGTLTDTETQAITMGGAVNTAPVIGAVTYVNGVLTVPVTDAENDNVTVTVSDVAGFTYVTNTGVVAGSGNAVFTWTGTGTGDTTITATDPGLLTDTATQTITTTVVNTAPVIGAVAFDGATGVLTVPVSDNEGDTITVTVTNVAGFTYVTNNGSVNGSGDATFTWTGSGSGDTTITASDGALSDTATQTITMSSNEAPVIGAVTYAGGVLTVPVTDPNAADALSVTVTAVTGLSVTPASMEVTGLATGDSAVFTWAANDPLVGGTGDTTITLTDGSLTDTATQTITIAAWGPFAADTLYVMPSTPTATLTGGVADVTMWVITGNPAHDLQFLSSVGFTVEDTVNYVADSFDLGLPGGSPKRKTADGYWGLMGAGTPPTADQFLDLGDSFMPGTPVGIAGGLHRYNFAVVTMGPFAAASVPNGAVLFTFQLHFTAAGTFNLGFQLQDDTVVPPNPQTYYADETNTSYNWAALTPATITVN